MKYDLENDYVTEDVDFIGCDPVIKQAISVGKLIRCETEEGKCWVVGYNSNLIRPYISTDESIDWAKPIKRDSKRKVKSYRDLVLQLLDGGYVPKDHYWVSSGPIVFDNNMFRFCGKEPNTNNVWLEEWLEEVEHE